MGAALPEGLTRFTPTGVGKSRVRRLRPQAARVHPHGRGEKWSVFVGFGGKNGSPPRAWGKGSSSSSSSSSSRFTPTGVGKSVTPPDAQPSW